MLLEKLVLWIKNFFRVFFIQNNHQNNTFESSETAKNTTQVSYNENLITNLQDDHQNLLHMYIAMHEQIQNKNYDAVVESLNQFKEAFNLHLMQENVKFYAYFDQNFAEESKEYITIKSYRKEMNQIAYAVVKFLKKWATTEELNADSEALFLEEYDAIADALVKRIESEEAELYVLYRAV